MTFIKKHISNLFFAVFISILIFNPFGIGLQIKSKLIQLISFSPSTVSVEERQTLQNYNWKLISNSGKEINFSEYKAKVVLVNYWATWCPPCVAEMPSIQKLYDDYKDKIEFVLVTSDSKEKADKFLKKHQYTFPVYFEQTAPLKEFETSSIPITFLIDKKGSIIINKKGAADWNSKSVREIIDKLI